VKSIAKAANMDDENGLYTLILLLGFAVALAVMIMHDP
jgi:hypothetical protein